MRGVAGSWPGRQTCVQVAVPDGGHAGVELAGVAEELVRPLVVACCMRGPGVQDQPPGGNLLLVPLPEPGTGGVQGGGVVNQLAGLVQVSCPVGLVGGYSGAIGIHATTVAQTYDRAGGVLRLRSGRPIVTVSSRTHFRRGWMASGFRRTTADFLPRGPGTARILLRHAVQGLVDVTDSVPGGGEFVGVREGLADAVACVGDLAARVLDVGQCAGLACLQLGKAVF